MTALDRFQKTALRGRDLYEEIAKSHPSLLRGLVWCRKCGEARKVDPAACMRSGWPRCPCNGHTMTIDAPKAEATS
jgi:hypothetical protein